MTYTEMLIRIGQRTVEVERWNLRQKRKRQLLWSEFDNADGETKIADVREEVARHMENEDELTEEQVAARIVKRWRLG